MKQFNTHAIVDDHHQEVIVRYVKPNHLDPPEIIGIGCGLIADVTDRIPENELHRIRLEMLEQARETGIDGPRDLFVKDMRRTRV